MEQGKSKYKDKLQSITIQTKLITVFILTALLILIVNLFMYSHINRMMKKLEEVYLSNIRLNQLEDTLTKIQTSLSAYLNTKTSISMEDYYRYEQDYRNLIYDLNGNVTNNTMDVMERNIKRMSENYLHITDQAIEAKRGRNVEKYRIRYGSAVTLYHYIKTYTYSLNNEQFRNNSLNYEMLLKSLKYLETISTFIMAIVAFTSVVLITLVTRTITNPLTVLAGRANQVAKGNFEVELIRVTTKDEVGVVSMAFNKMVVSIQDYIQKLKEGMDKERQHKENELRMQTHLKDAQLKYLQAQINPHFLFNTLNAGAQLAMMEDADKTNAYIQHVADFYRYNVRKNNDTVTLREEITLVDHYIYILNVRFSGKIHFLKQVDESTTGICMPSMILQPIVENSVNYGIRNIDWQGSIVLSVYEKEKTVYISIKDNGIGMSQELIDQIMDNRLKSVDLSKDSNGVGLGNVITRLQLFYECENVFRISSEGKDKGTEVLICIPLEKGEQDDVQNHDCG
jgi:two-component system sensor histidine kinase YesM